MLDAVRRVLSQAGWGQDALNGIGIGCAGPVNPTRGTIHNPYTLPGWDNADMVTPLREALRVPVRLENDADAAAVGEYYFGAGRVANPLVMVTLGTGIGGGTLVNGQIYRGVHGEHPELGHIRVLPDGPACYCGARGCWESLASGTAIAEGGKTFGFEDSHAVFAAVERDSRAAEIVERAVNATVIATWSLVHALLPQQIILGGGIGAEHFERFAVPLRKQISLGTQFPKERVEIVKAQLGNDAGVIGAACLAFQNAKPQ
jgi:glucokinase